MEENCADNYAKKGGKLPFEQPIEVVKREHNYKLTVEKNQLSLPNRRSYNDHLGSENFINLLDGEQKLCAQSGHIRNNKSGNVVNHTLHNGEVKIVNNNNQRSWSCLPLKSLTCKENKIPSCPRSTSQTPVSMNHSPASEFASQTLKPFSLLNLESCAIDENELKSNHARYKLKESSPAGCLPGKGKSKKLQRKNSDRSEDVDDKPDEDYQRCPQEESQQCEQIPRSKSFFSSFIKFKKFRKKKKIAKVEFREASDGSNWDTESSEEHKQEESYDDNNEFVFGGVRVYLDESGECYELDEAFGLRSSMSSLSEEEEEEDEARNSRETSHEKTKFESRDSLNLGYSGSFTA